MSASVKAAIAAALVYLRDNPGVVAVIVGEAALVLAHFGLHLSTATLASAAAVALPILLAYFHVAKKASVKAAAKARSDAFRNAYLLDVPIALDEPEPAHVGEVVTEAAVADTEPVEIPVTAEPEGAEAVETA